MLVLIWETLSRMHFFFNSFISQISTLSHQQRHFSFSLIWILSSALISLSFLTRFVFSLSHLLVFESLVGGVDKLIPGGLWWQQQCKLIYCCGFVMIFNYTNLIFYSLRLIVVKIFYCKRIEWGLILGLVRVRFWKFWIDWLVVFGLDWFVYVFGLSICLFVEKTKEN